VQRLQVWLPLNPQTLANVTPDSAFDTAVSFVTNTNWQGYAGESTMSYFTQMIALAVQNFFSAASGLAVAFALMRGFARRSAQGIGSFWVDLTRGTLYVLLPLSLLLAIIFMGQGVIQNFDAYKKVSPLESLTYTQPKLDAAGQPLKDAAGNAVTETLTTARKLAMGWWLAEAIKMLALTAADSSTYPAHLRKTRHPEQFLQMIAMVDPRHAVSHVGRMVDASRLGGARRHDGNFRGDGSHRIVGRTARQTAVRASWVWTRTTVRCAGGNMEGVEARLASLPGAVCHHHHRRLRRGECRA
jgi:K+-transporting ATPase ATPase A chain